MSQFTEVPVKALALQHPLKYANSPLSPAKLREASVSSSLIRRLQNHLSALKVNLEYIKGANITDFVARGHRAMVNFVLVKGSMWLSQLQN